MLFSVPFKLVGTKGEVLAVGYAALNTYGDGRYYPAVPIKVEAIMSGDLKELVWDVLGSACRVVTDKGWPRKINRGDTIFLEYPVDGVALTIEGKAGA